MNTHLAVRWKLLESGKVLNGILHYDTSRSGHCKIACASQPGPVASRLNLPPDSDYVIRQSSPAPRKSYVINEGDIPPKRDFHCTQLGQE